MSEVKTKADELVASYIEVRNAKAEAQQRVSELQDKLNDIGDILLDICAEQGVEGLKTVNGTVSRRVRERYWTGDWEAMHEFIIAENAPFLLEQRIHNGHMKQFLEDNPDLLPVGLNSDRRYVALVRKASKK